MKREDISGRTLRGAAIDALHRMSLENKMYLDGIGLSLLHEAAEDRVRRGEEGLTHEEVEVAKTIWPNPLEGMSALRQIQMQAEEELDHGRLF